VQHAQQVQYYPAGAQHQQQMVAQTVAVVMVPRAQNDGVLVQMYGPLPQVAQCPFRSHLGPTAVTKVKGKGHTKCCRLSGLGCLVGVGCFYLCCSDEFKDSVHSCQHCGGILGVYEKKVDYCDYVPLLDCY
jgi:hypothetical protein